MLCLLPVLSLLHKRPSPTLWCLPLSGLHSPQPASHSPSHRCRTSTKSPKQMIYWLSRQNTDIRKSHLIFKSFFLLLCSVNLPPRCSPAAGELSLSDSWVDKIPLREYIHRPTHTYADILISAFHLSLLSEQLRACLLKHCSKYERKSSWDGKHSLDPQK